VQTSRKVGEELKDSSLEVVTEKNMVDLPTIIDLEPGPETETKTKSTNTDEESNKHVFKYVTRVDDHSVKCNSCKKALSYEVNGKYGTGNLWKHPCLKNLDQKKLSWNGVEYIKPLSPEEANISHHFLLKIIAEDDRPFNVFLTDAFKGFCHSLNPAYKLPNVEKLKQIMSNTSSTVQEKLKKLI